MSSTENQCPKCGGPQLPLYNPDIFPNQQDWLCTWCGHVEQKTVLMVNVTTVSNL